MEAGETAVGAVYVTFVYVSIFLTSGTLVLDFGFIFLYSFLVSIFLFNVPPLYKEPS